MILADIMKKLQYAEPINKEEFIFYMSECAREYWNEAEEHEDAPPELMPSDERLADFAIYFKENCAS